MFALGDNYLDLNHTQAGTMSPTAGMIAGNTLVTTVGTALYDVHLQFENSTGHGISHPKHHNNTNQSSIPFGDDRISLNYGFAAMVVVGVILGAVMIGTIFGNTLVLLSLIKFNNLKTVSNYLIGNLAVSDFFLAAGILPFSAVNEMLGYWVFGETLCKLWLSMDVLLSTASIWSLCVIAFDRFTATLYPLWYREKRSKRQAVLYITIVWVISTIICVPPILGWDDPSKLFVFNEETGKYMCFLFETQSYVLYSASGSFFIPFFITLFLYIRIFAVLRKRIKKMQQARKQRKKNQLAMQSKHLCNTNTNNVNKDKANGQEAKESGIELGQIPPEHDGSGNTEEYSSRSLFGSDSKSDDDSTSAHEERAPGYTSNSESETARILKNGFKGSKNREETLVILNPTHTFTESENLESDLDKGQSAISTDDEMQNKRIIKTAIENHKNKSKKTALSKLALPNTAETQPLDGKSGQQKSKGFSEALKQGQFRFQRGEQLRASEKRRFDKREQRATKRMAIIIAFFCFCWAPFFLIYVINSLCGLCKIPIQLHAFVFWLGYSNSAMNPILYTVFNVEFRRSFQKLLGCKPAKRGRK